MKCHRSGRVKRSPGSRALAALVGAVLCVGAAPAQPAEAQNLARNGQFHSDTENWSLVFGSLLLWTDLTEEGECPGSGAALIPSEPVLGEEVAQIEQCITLHDETNLFVHVRHQGYGTFRIHLDFFTATNCAAGALTFADSNEAQTPSVWDTLVLSAVPPENANGVRIHLSAGDSEPHGLLVDGITVTEHSPLFLDGFDGSDGETPPCRWDG